MSLTECTRRIPNALALVPVVLILSAPVGVAAGVEGSAAAADGAGSLGGARSSVPEEAPADSYLTWARTYGRADWDERIEAVRAMPDGGVVVVGSVRNAAGGVARDGWVARLDPIGRLLWERSYGGSLKDWLVSVDVTPDGGYLAGGSITTAAGGDDFWLLRLDSNGAVLWEKTIAGSSYQASAVLATSDGGGAVVGTIQDGVILEKFDVFGARQWSTRLGLQATNARYILREKPTGGYRLATTHLGDVQLPYWPYVINLDANGNVLSEHFLEITQDLVVDDMLLTPDGGFVLVGTDWDTTGYAFATKVDSAGSVEWKKELVDPGTYGEALGVARTSDGDLVLAGYRNRPGYDGWVVRLGPAGELRWQRTYRPGTDSFFSSIALTPAGEIIAAGAAGPGVEQFPIIGVGDAYVVRLRPDGLLDPACAVVENTATVASDVPHLISALLPTGVPWTGLLVAAPTSSAPTAVPAVTECSAGICDDADADTYGVLGDPACAGGIAVDCNDANAEVHPGAPEICDGLDDDCNGATPAVEADADHDGWRLCAGDCDDANPVRFPGNPELCDGIDNDCDLVVPSNEADGDVDGYRICAGDCNDASPAQYPGHPELCDTLDNDCNGTADNGLPPTGGTTLTVTNPLLSWGPVANAADYDLVRGSIATLRSSRGDFTTSTAECVVNDHPARSFSYSSSPPARDGFWFLVRGVSGCGVATYDDGGPSQIGLRDAEIAASPAACP